MSDGLRPKDIRYADKVEGPKRRTINKKNKIISRQLKRATRERSQRAERDLQWGAFLTPDKLLDLELRMAKEEIAIFMRRTDRNPNLRHTHYHMKRRGITVMDVITQDLHKPKSWLTLKWTDGHRRMLTKDELTKVCVKLQVKYWREMLTREKMAVLFVLSWMDGMKIEDNFE